MYSQSVSFGAMDTMRTNKVLRNTFGLVGLSLIPTALAAWASIGSGFVLTMMASPWMSLGIFLVAAIVLMLGIFACKDNGLGVVFMMLFAGLMGTMISTSLQATLGLKNGGELITLAALGTAAIMAACSVYAMTTKKDFSGFGGALLGATVGLIVVSLLGIFLQIPFLSLLISGAAMLLFSFWLIYDVQQIVTGGEDNYIVAALGIYLDMINIFVNLLHILTAVAGDD